MRTGSRRRIPATVRVAFVAAGLIAVALPPAGISAVAAGSGPQAAADCTIVGTSHADVLDGTDGDDVICGEGGNDVLKGHEGDDTLIGGLGADDLIGGSGDDTLEGDEGADRLEGNGGVDTLVTEDGTEFNDAAGGGTGDDACSADDGDWCSGDGTAFGGESSKLTQAQKDEMTGVSWREGCPVPLGNLRYLEMNYRDWKQKVRRGVMVVHMDQSSNVLDAFETMFDARFPIKKMVLIDEYDANDDRSMADDNTVGFNCRYLAGTHTWSQHAYGRAIDVLPIENPYVKADGSFVPPAGEKYLDRSKDSKGMIHHGDEVWDAFRDVGWEWGGDWTDSKDYQHFSSNGK